jgi:hypothetical protein
MNKHFTNITEWPNDSFVLPNYDIAVVTGTYNRAHLLLRSLFHYQACKRPREWDLQAMNINGGFSATSKDMSICLVVMDDGSTDFTRELCEKFANEQLPIYYFYMGDKQPGEWRDSAAFINRGMSFALHGLGASFVFPTHPEICVGEDTIATIVDYCKENPDAFGMAKGYYLTPEQQVKYGFEISDCKEMIEDKTHSSICEFPTNIARLSISKFIQENPDFYDYGDPTHAYHHTQVEKAKVWDSWIFCGASRQTWLKFGGFGESNAWGSIDLNFHHRRYQGGFISWTPDGQNNMVVHQNHDDPNQNTVTPRNMELCMDTAGKLNHEPCQPELLNPERWIK